MLEAAWIAVDEFLNHGDIRQKFLIRYPSVSIAIVIAYILFVKWIGPAIMANRKPFELKYLMIVYDFGHYLLFSQ
ncbi:hypothetical protein JTE90_029617 [Oedothorax gibbosus]|uniref:Very-long-chain 3-oxoacyl-CoA synthase n=1 Tax=Oedothorax gibbosus TaxID=931172 RepID=A0AAV6VG52_9ARAC|nr:hypothetical protein JTE90_029617 [Oedothorax gibbosus]KAG8195037.1 hypothetical protein JTE90_029617 [Oedothorax gibbosus]